jgi:ADP-ribose pyrophosphatase YjhB (NUDIX family)
VSGKTPRIRVAGILTRGDEILLVKHEREGRQYFLLPGGGLEWGETCAEGLAREFEEELSLQVSVGPLLLINESIDPAGRRHIVNLTFTVKRRGGTLKLHADRRLKDVAWVSRRELGKLAFYPEVRKELLRAWARKFKQPVSWVETHWE